MTIRIVYRCSRCGSPSFRRSTQWTFKDTILHKFGILAQRCFHCRRRFYLFRPVILQSFLRSLAASGPRLDRAARKPLTSDVMSHSRTIDLSSLRNAQAADGRSQTASENLAG